MSSTRRAKPAKIAVLDLYCGLGGFSVGFELTGAFKALAGIDHFQWAIRTFNENHRCQSKLMRRPLDMATLNPEAVLDDLGQRPDVVVGGPPCQGFSDAGQRLDDLREDHRNQHVFHFFRFVRALRPRAFVMENVSGILRTGQSQRHELIDLLVREYEAAGYAVAWKVLNAADYRVPQNRKRFVLVGLLGRRWRFRFPNGVTSGEAALFTEPALTVIDALGDVPTPRRQDPQPYECEPKRPLQRFLRAGSEALFNHLETFHSPTMVSRLAAQLVGTRLYPNWNHSWYRLDPNRPSPAVKENHRAPFVHFAEPRATSPRECARLQTVPDRVRLLGTKTAQLIMVGNAVPPVLVAHVATEVSRQAFGCEPPMPWDATSNPLATA